LEHLDDPLVNELFISIIKLMEFICRKAQDESLKAKNDLFDSMSESLNEGRREDALFNALKIPNDEVRLQGV
jgi:hypothetical protein